jgi:mono/diheme cytochrome c family protein
MDRIGMPSGVMTMERPAVSLLPRWPWAGWLEDWEEEDDRRGFEAPEGASQCGTCHGAGGHTETQFTDKGARIDTWHPCPSCRGTGQA